MRAEIHAPKIVSPHETLSQDRDIILREGLPQPTDTATISSERLNQLFLDLDDITESLSTINIFQIVR
jgi:hypothetical protein